MKKDVFGNSWITIEPQLLSNEHLCVNGMSSKEITHFKRRVQEYASVI